MFSSVPNDTFSVCKDAAGIAGNIFAFGLFVSPVPTFRRIIRNQSTELFSGLPYIYALLNCLICLWYGAPLVSSDNVMVMTVNSIGAAFQLVYIIIFTTCAEKQKKVTFSFSLVAPVPWSVIYNLFTLHVVNYVLLMYHWQIRMFGLLLAVFAIFATIVYASLQMSDQFTRWLFVGLLSCASLISMFASPLFIIKLVIRTKSVEFMPFYLSLSTFLMSTSFFLYGMFNHDAFIYVPNGIGTVLGIVQLALYFYYSKKSREDEKEPLIESVA